MTRVILITLLLSFPAQAADKMLILNDQEQAALRAILDTAIHAQGLTAVSRNAFVFSDKLDAAGPPPPPKEPPQ
jgi:hypothetical protein